MVDAVFEEGLAISDTEAILFALGQVVEQRDKHTAGHCERLAFTGVALGTAMGWSARNFWRSIAAATSTTSARWESRIQSYLSPAN